MNNEERLEKRLNRLSKWAGRFEEILSLSLKEVEEEYLVFLRDKEEEKKCHTCKEYMFLDDFIIRDDKCILCCHCRHNEKIDDCDECMLLEFVPENKELI